MKEFPIPVVAFGPGSQEEDEQLEYIAAPGEMSTFQTPRLPEAGDAAVRDGAVAVLGELLARMRATPFGTPLGLDLTPLEAPVRRLVNEALGEGEVAATVAGDIPMRVQETVFAGVWRVMSDARGDRPAVDRIECGPMPRGVIEAGRAGALGCIEAPPLTDGVMNAPAVLSELNQAVQSRMPGDAAHIVNLTLLPMTPEDLAYLGEALGVGPVVILSRGYGNCRITRTRLRDTWWVQYFNSSDKLILNTLEVTGLPDVAPAAEEDYADSIVRLEEWIEALGAE
jgi:hydrogenase-1 operon protein HyaF